MTTEQRIRNYVSTNVGKQFCDDCLSSVLRIEPRQQVQQKTSALGQLTSFRRAPGICNRCHSNRIVIEAVPSKPVSPSRDSSSTETLVSPIIPVAAAPSSLTASEKQYCERILVKDRAIRTYLAGHSLPEAAAPSQWLAYLVGLKDTLGNINNDVAFAATMLVKQYLEQRFATRDFDPAEKAQGAAGVDIKATTGDGKSFVGELKTTKPYQPGFGAKQREMILKDLKRLAGTQADYRFMFVTDTEAFATLKKKSFASQAPGVEVVDLVEGGTFVCS